MPSAAAQNAAIPLLSAPGSGWLEVGDDFLAPPTGPGPVMADPAHPYHSNLSGLQPTYRVADLNNPILQPWVVERLRKTNERVLSGKVPFQAHERCWPTGVPGFEVFSLLRPIYFVQGPKEVLIINEGDFQVLSDHAPVMTAVRPGVVGIDDAHGKHIRVFVRGGFADASKNGVILLAETAIPFEELSAEELGQEIKNAEEDLADANEEQKRLAQEKLDRLRELKDAIKL